MYARRRPGRRTIGVVLPDSFTEIGSLEQVVAHYRPEVIACIPEEVLGSGRKLLEDSERGGESSPRSCQIDLWSRTTRQIVVTVERLCPEVAAGKLLCTVHYGRISRFTPYRRKET